ncbi:hypothetical protein OAT67_04350 [Bacteriovoracaceae bacterium]|nr:hypothetical protein [Bacteriovoracaceae bacterium]
MEVGPQRSFQVQWEDKQNQKYSCEWNWGRSIIPNTIPIFFGPVGFGLSAIFHSVDLYNGRFYNCDQLVHRENLKKLRSKKLKAFLITPRHKDSEISKKIMEVFYKRINREKLKVVNIDQSFDRLSDFGINNLKTPSLKEIPFKRLRKYALEVGAEHAVLFNIKQVEKKLVIQPVIIDLVSEGMIDTKSYGFDDKNISNQIWEKIVDVVNFIPNSLTASYFTNPRIKKIKEDETSFRTKNHPDQFPKFVSAIGMTSVIHPQNFETWDYSFQSFPSVGGSSWQRTEAGQWVNISNYHLFYNAEVSGHFALGALNIGVGYGLGTFKVEDSLPRLR